MNWKRLRFYSLLLASCVVLQVSCGDEAYRQEMATFYFEQNKKFKDPERSPLNEEDRKHFSKLPFFEINKDYRIEAEFTRTPGEQPFEMPTTTDRLPVYMKYGVANFELEGNSIELEIYQNVELRNHPQYGNQLFLPFTDLTNGKESYAGGRYIDLEIPESDEIIIDFNKSYNPYCAYNSKYSCPIPPEANRIDISIFAGIKAPSNH